MIQRYGMAVLLAFAWVFLTGRFALDSFILGLVIGLALVFIRPANDHKPETQFRGFQALPTTFIYILEVLREILVSDFLVARRILSPKPVDNSGIVELTVGCECETIAAMSAHAITAAPGSMVIDFDDNNQTMQVHVIDRAIVEDLEKEQLRRFSMCERMLDR